MPIGRPKISPEKKKEHLKANQAKQVQNTKDLSAKYKSMGLDLRKGRYSKQHNDLEKQKFYEKYNIMVA